MHNDGYFGLDYPTYRRFKKYNPYNYRETDLKNISISYMARQIFCFKIYMPIQKPLPLICTKKFNKL